ncbi:MAG TPA: hypothetical protein PKW38_00475, partial [Paludibacteraceae bacterium]|nr:hypothetical protein [Paludibacteraceae bacterium]
MVERITEGFVPYKTLHLGYTPLWFYMMAFIKLLFGIPNGSYEFFLLIHYLFSIGTMFLLYKIAYYFTKSKNVALFSGWLFFLMAHWLQGNVILLEIPSLFFGLLGCWLLLSFPFKSICWYLLIGGVSSCSFLIKQFGFGFFFLSIYLLIFYRKDFFRERIILFILGYIIPIFLCFIIWKSSFLSVVFSGYGTTTAQEAGYDVSLKTKLDGIFYILKYFCFSVCPMVIIALFF